MENQCKIIKGNIYVGEKELSTPSILIDYSEGIILKIGNLEEMNKIKSEMINHCIRVKESLLKEKKFDYKSLLIGSMSEFLGSLQVVDLQERDLNSREIIILLNYILNYSGIRDFIKNLANADSSELKLIIKQIEIEQEEDVMV